MHPHPFRRLPLVAGVVLAMLAGCTSEAPSSSPVETSRASLDDGEYFGFVTDVDAAGGTITFDPATWVVADDEPNGYRIDNDEVDDEILPVRADAEIDVLLQAGDPATAATVDLEELEDWFRSPASGQEVAFDVTVADGEATALAFRYRP
ncbi:MAG TPA: hypothetical protein VK906_08980 [Egicoccus sp.]|nr:hypothetical protein [Egicoccus sp.]HSK23296.1 hypothetical protein [Egicoccus sp.]